MADEATPPETTAAGDSALSSGTTPSVAEDSRDKGPITAAQAQRLITRFLIGAVIAAFVVLLAGKMILHLQELLTAVAIAIFLSLAL